MLTKVVRFISVSCNKELVWSYENSALQNIDYQKDEVVRDDATL